jgi:Holliday junction resolvase
MEKTRIKKLASLSYFTRRDIKLPLINSKGEALMLVDIVIKAVSQLIERDNKIIERKLKEECINHRLALYIQGNLPICLSWVMVDVEYDKNYDKPKEIEGSNGEKYKIRPDILVHKREDNYNNMIAIECKKRHLNKLDKIKLKKLLEPPYSYKLSLGISYQPKKKYFLFYVPMQNNFKIFHFDKFKKEIKEGLDAIRKSTHDYRI